MKISNALCPDNPEINYEADDKDRFVERKGTRGIRYRTWDVYFELPRIILSNRKPQKSFSDSFRLNVKFLSRTLGILISYYKQLKLFQIDQASRRIVKLYVNRVIRVANNLFQ